MFETGTFWVGSFVGFLGLLILSNKWYSGRGKTNYGMLQFVTVASYLAAVAFGLIFGINALTGIAGTFLVFYLAAKVIEIETHSMIGFGTKLIVVGGIIFFAWHTAMQNEEVVKNYLTVTLPA